MKRFLLAFRLILTIVVALTGFSLAPLPQAKAESFYYTAYPQGTVGILKPKIGFQITQSSIASVSHIALKLDGQRVTGQYDAASMTYTYQPEQPLAKGAHTVAVSVEFAGYEPIEQEWSFTVSSLSVTEPPTSYSDKQREMVRAINDYRLLYGLPSLQINPNLTMAAKMHAEYLQTNNIDTTQVSMHVQTKSLPGYIGEKPGERALYAGYYDHVAEDVSYHAGTHIGSVDSLFDAPYHRLPFLLPSAKDIGVAVVGPFVVLEFGFQEQDQQQLVVTPAPGEKYVPVAFNGHEDPDPIRMHQGAAYPVGYPIVAHISGSNTEEVKLVEARLTDAKGHAVELLQNTPKNDEHLIQEVILTPAKPLLPDASYTAYVKMTASHNGSIQTFEKTWQFQTEPAETVGKSKLHADAAAYKKLTEQKSEAAHVVSFSLNDTSYTLDGVQLDMKLAPLVIDGSSYLWVRDLAAALGAQIEWNEAQKAAIYTKDGRTISFFTTRPTYALDGVEASTDVPAKLVNENTMIPVRLLSEVLGAKVEYIPEDHSVSITY
ncbi:stalk domain-containing protein [Paenibacillus puerhi]|uniref:stalk domain-containing protein n=1 Tax=Paenibacillus puerhi TaxID=2692622 RepID=UPI0013586F7D|nr:stalk domain-containing protein [Paenibacillus puerhi]